MKDELLCKNQYVLARLVPVVLTVMEKTVYAAATAVIKRLWF